LLDRKRLYGLCWGDPEVSPPLMHVRDHFLRPYISAHASVVEIGPGGGRWTRYMIAAARIYAVDYHQELLDELSSNFGGANITFVRNNGDDFPDVPDRGVDFVFSFGTFVHLDLEIIDRYLENMRRILRDEATVVLQYSDKTKEMARKNSGFAENDPTRMRDLVQSRGYSIAEEDLESLPHSSIIRFGLEGFAAP
jgi:ubiquinone/menaquinone biosynthesis C-methylase UbiE